MASQRNQLAYLGRNWLELKKVQCSPTLNGSVRMDTEFEYLIKRIADAEFASYPFKHLYLENFLSDQHLGAIISAEEIARPVFDSTSEMIEDLLAVGYEVQPFPGCVNSVKDYLAHHDSGNRKFKSRLVEGFGLTMRLSRYREPLLSRLVDFLNSGPFKLALEEKFGISESNFVETAIQKYLDGYEISPHPDIRKKALTYMLNINTSELAEKENIHTHLLKFRPEYRYLYDFWRYNTEIDRCWVPWDWCESAIETNSNNSIVIFAPSDETMHAVSLRYDHLQFQRTQVYGNLWYDESPAKYKLDHSQIDLCSRQPGKVASLAKSALTRLGSVIRRTRGYTGS